MTRKIVSIGGTPAPGDPVPEVLMILRGLLAEAERGNVRSIALTWTDGGRSIFTNWHSDNDYFALMGSAGFLHHRMLVGSKID